MVDKEGLYGEYQKVTNWKHNLFKKAAHKSLDIPEDDMQINNTRTGIGWKELLVVAAGIAGGAWWMNLPTPTGPTDSEYEVRFYDQDGGRIDIPRFSEKGIAE